MFIVPLTDHIINLLIMPTGQTRQKTGYLKSHEIIRSTLRLVKLISSIIFSLTFLVRPNNLIKMPIGHIHPQNSLPKSMINTTDIRIPTMREVVKEQFIAARWRKPMGHMKNKPLTFKEQ